jgi:hypothetical protein
MSRTNDVPNTVCVVDPLQQPALLVQTQHRVCAQPEIPTATLRCLLQQAVHHCIELHHARVLAQVAVLLYKCRSRQSPNDSLHRTFHDNYLYNLSTLYLAYTEISPTFRM